MTTRSDSNQPMGQARVNRRTLLRGIAATGATTALGALLAACGGSSTATDTPKPATGAATTAPAATTGTTSGAASAPAATTASSSGGSTAPTTAPTQAASAAGTPKKGGTLRAGLNGEIGNLDPLLSGFVSDRQVFYSIYDSLVAIDTNLKIIPALAEKWETPDPKTYIFSLRKDVKFHDGTDFNADAVKFNIERYLNDKKSRRASEINSIQTVEVMDPYTVKFNLKAPFAPLLANLVDRAGMMLSPKAVQAGGEDFTRKPLGAGTGPFKFVEFVVSDHITVERNPTYWKKDASGTQLPYLDKIVWRIITDETVRLTNMKTGDLEATYLIPPKDVASLKNASDLVYREAPGLSFESFEFNTQKEPFNKKELRQAVAELMDRDQINKTVYFGVLQPGFGPIPPSSWAFDASLKPFTVNVAKAKEYLKAGGKPDGFTFEYLGASGSPLTVQLLQLVKDQVAKAGITMTIQLEDGAKAANDTQAGAFQASGYGWSGCIDPDGNIYNQIHTGGSLADTKYSNPQVDDLLDKARSTTDQAQRKDLYQQAQKLFVEEAPFAFYGFQPAQLLTRPNVQGMQIYADYIMRFHEVWLK